MPRALQSHVQTLAKKWLHALRPNPSRKYLHDFASRAAVSLPPSALVLDAGAGNCPYRHLFAHAKYESADFGQLDKEYGQLTYVCDLAELPVEANRYDLILLTQVLEHLPEPLTVLHELYRVLKPTGELWLSAPLFFAEHEAPFDFYRYTRFGLRHLLESAGFAIQRIEWLEGYYGTLSYQMATAATALPMTPSAYGGGLIGMAAACTILLIKPFALLLSVMFARLDLRQRHTSSGYCKNYALVALKSGARNEPP